jgi:hypothetical protein
LARSARAPAALTPAATITREVRVRRIDFAVENSMLYISKSEKSSLHHAARIFWAKIKYLRKKQGLADISGFQKSKKKRQSVKIFDANRCVAMLGMFRGKTASRGSPPEQACKLEKVLSPISSIFWFHPRQKICFHSTVSSHGLKP